MSDVMYGNPSGGGKSERLTEVLTEQLNQAQLDANDTRSVLDMLTVEAQSLRTALAISRVQTVVLVTQFHKEMGHLGMWQSCTGHICRLAKREVIDHEAVITDEQAQKLADDQVQKMPKLKRGMAVEELAR